VPLLRLAKGPLSKVAPPPGVSPGISGKSTRLQQLAKRLDIIKKDKNNKFLGISTALPKRTALALTAPSDSYRKGLVIIITKNIVFVNCLFAEFDEA
jgi:hypothetical protein